MTTVHSVLGALVLVVTTLDLLWTTLWVEGGAGPLSSRLMSWTWGTLRSIGTRHPAVRTVAGPLILLLGLVMWIALLWTGWTLVFANGALIDTVESGPVSWVERFYFVGYAMFTMGNGGLVPEDGIWQVATGITTASGMLFVTLSITYVLSVLDAVTQKRTFANNVSGLGTRGERIVTKSWNGDAFDGVDLPLDSLTADLNELTANHKAYPILHYFYTENREAAAVHSVAVLDEAVTLWELGVPDGKGPSRPILENARSSLENYLETVSDDFVTPSDERPPPPDLTVLRDADVPTVSEEAFADALEQQGERRRTLRGLVEADARQWPEARAD